MDVTDRAEELASDLGADTAEVKADLENLLEYSVPLDEAVQSVRRKHGGGDGGGATPTSVDLAEITTDHGNVTVTVRVLTRGTRSIRYQGDDLTIHEGELADETGTIDYTAWQDFGFEPGDSLTIGNAGIREWEGAPELNLNESTTVAIADEPVAVDRPVGGERRRRSPAATERRISLRGFSATRPVNYRSPTGIRRRHSKRAQTFESKTSTRASSAGSPRSTSRDSRRSRRCRRR
jgi:replication factor A1